MKTKVGLLIDLNSFPQFSREDDPCNDENSPMEEDVFNNSGSSGSDSALRDPRLEAKLHQLEEFILEQLTREATRRGECNPSDLQFTYRYYNSSNYVHPVKELRTFVPLNANSFDIFEKSLEAEVGNIHVSGKELCPDTNRMSLMSSAFKGMISDFEWDSTCGETEPSSASMKSYASSSNSSSPDSDGESNRNVLYVFFRVPKDEDEMLDFLDDVPDKLDIATSSTQFRNALVPKAFLEIMQTYQMRVNFVDMWSLHDKNHYVPSNSAHPPSILKVLRLLNGGQIYLPSSNTSVAPGLPSVKVLLKGFLKGHSTPVPTATRASDSETTHVSGSGSSNCSTPAHQGVPSMLQVRRNLGPGSVRSDSDSKCSTDKNRLRKDVLLFNSQSQRSLSSQKLSGSQPCLPSFRPT